MTTKSNTNQKILNYTKKNVTALEKFIHRSIFACYGTNVEDEAFFCPRRIFC
jgi:hypothetical protein